MSIAKIKTNNSARATFKYAVSKAGARVIGGGSAPWIERDHLSDQELKRVIDAATHKFMIAINLNNRVKRAVGHTSISFPPGQELNDEQMGEYCEKYLAAMILTSEKPELLRHFDEQKFRAAVDNFRYEELHKYFYSVIRHTDQPHPHAHIVHSRINLETERAISTSFERYRSQQILRDLERQYELEVLPNSWEVGRKAQSISQIEQEAETGKISVQTRLQEILEQAGAASKTMLEFLKAVQSRGVQVRVGFTRTGKSKGISYSLDGVALAGNALGNRYSFKHHDPGLCKAFGLAYEPTRDNEMILDLCQQQPVSQTVTEVDPRLTSGDTALLSTGEWGASEVIAANGDGAESAPAVIKPDVDTLAEPLTEADAGVTHHWCGDYEVTEPVEQVTEADLVNAVVLAEPDLIEPVATVQTPPPSVSIKPISGETAQAQAMSKVALIQIRIEQAEEISEFLRFLAGMARQFPGSYDFSLLKKEYDLKFDADGRLSLTRRADKRVVIDRGQPTPLLEQSDWQFFKEYKLEVMRQEQRRVEAAQTAKKKSRQRSQGR